MKRKKSMQIFLLSILALCSHQNAFANEQSKSFTEENSSVTAANSSSKPIPSCNKEPSSCEFKQRASVGGNYTYAWITPDGSATTRGSLGGAQVLYEYRPAEFFYGAAFFSWRMGTTENDVTERKIQDFNVQERLGYTFEKKSANSRCTVFSGFGARHLAETVIVGAASVDYDYTEFYLPVGILFENQVNSLFSWGCNFQWMPQIFPLVKIQPLGGAQWSLSYQLLNAFVETPLIFSAYGDRLSVSISPFVESWHDGHSTAVTSFGFALGLPSNTYLFTGVNVNLLVSF